MTDISVLLAVLALICAGGIGWGVVAGAGPSDDWDAYVAEALKHLEEEQP